MEGDEWTENIRRGGRGGTYGRDARERPGGFAKPRGIDAEPYQVMFGLMLEDLQELHDEIKGYYVSWGAVGLVGVLGRVLSRVWGRVGFVIAVRVVDCCSGRFYSNALGLGCQVCI